ncbi:hypothetical protein RHO12_00860 [Orbus sturtevantii]|uniref:hypothetical protein n=1 Tax=Orbus sturtevantii TaxID=3074109 RepID=UPI00370DB567
MKIDSPNENKLAIKIIKIICVSLIFIGIGFLIYYQLFINRKDIRADIILLSALLLLQFFYFLFKRDFSATKIKMMLIEISVVLVLWCI